jgi:hypothetical protein
MQGAALASGLLDWLGSPASIAIASGAVFGAFQALEAVASPAKKADLAAFLRSADWTILPHRITAACMDAFESIFGVSHLSGKCLRRSIIFSLLSISVLLIVASLKNHRYFSTMPEYVLYHPGYKVIFFGWLFWSILFDYFNLYKTRLLVRLVDTKIAIPVLVFLLLVAIDLIISFAVFDISQNFLRALSMIDELCSMAPHGCWKSLPWALRNTFSIFLILSRDPHWLAQRLRSVIGGPTADEVAVFFWSGLLPTLWLLIYVLATAATRYLVSISDLITFTIGWLDIDKPFQMIGFVAACMVGFSMAVYELVLLFVAAV